VNEPDPSARWLRAVGTLTATAKALRVSGGMLWTDAH
jgi:hypothetical protein